MEIGRDDLIQKMIRVIVQTVNPRRIILFGSRARGNARTASDVDFLIVKDKPFLSGKSRREEMTQIWQSLAPYSVEQDILLYSQDEIDQWSQTKNHVIARALKEGIVLYERP
ncbi:MAG TPA: nucleotidyltransferase domain-containing protein [bacterium]|nr:nucleotidyltransferase domain-containing protein [bacterium]